MSVKAYSCFGISYGAPLFYLFFCFCLWHPLSSANPANAKPAVSCEALTKPFISDQPDWEEYNSFATDLPDHCFDGYIAEGISDSLIKKINSDWPGFMKFVSKKRDTDAFVRLMFRSINESLAVEDLQKLSTRASMQCDRQTLALCKQISKLSHKALKSAATQRGR
jgi:hypothetical protein